MPRIQISAFLKGSVIILFSSLSKNNSQLSRLPAGIKSYSLLRSILQKAGYNTFLGGNIGTPLFTRLPEIKPDDIVVLELSSFQLMNMHVSPDIAVITNITPNHLNIHKEYQEYIDAKKCIFKNQKR